MTAKPVVLRCPACNAQVNVLFRSLWAECRMCAFRWKWKREPKRVTLEAVR